MKKLQMTLMMIIVMICITNAKEYRYEIGSCSIIENTYGDMMDIEIIYDGYIKRGDLYIHVGKNGWQEIRDIHGYRNSFILQVPRNTVSLEFCFFSGKTWDNNNGHDYKINLRGFLPDSMMASLGDELKKYDLINERYQKISQHIYYLENVEKSADQNRQLETLYELREEARVLLPEIMRKKDIKKDSDLEYRFATFLAKTDGL